MQQGLLPKLRKTLNVAVTGLYLSTGAVVPAQAQSYPIDCAIILCIAGGWPASTECVRAKAEFIRRITPYPIEPPVQVWNCPMGASYNHPQSDPFEWLLNASSGSRAGRQAIQLAAQVVKIQQADIDISDSAFDAVRSIKVWDVQYSHRERGKDEDCGERGRVVLGTYGAQGNYQRTNVSFDDVPTWILPQRTCKPETWLRAVAVEWTDQAGNHGSEIVPY